MARSLSSVVGTLEKKLLQVEQGAQDEVRKLRAALVSSGGIGGSSIGGSGGSGSGSGGNTSKQALRNLGSELASGVRKLMRGHENNVRSLFAGREEAAMRQTEGLRVHVESTVEHSEERISNLVEHSTDMNSTLTEVNENVSHLLTMMSGWKRREEDRRQEDTAVAATVAVAAADVAVEGRDVPLEEVETQPKSVPVDRRGSIVPPTPPRSKVARGESGVDAESEDTRDGTQDGNQEEDTGEIESGEGGLEDTEQWIRVPGESGLDFYFNTVTKELWTEKRLPTNIVEAPTLDSSPIMPRK